MPKIAVNDIQMHYVQRGQGQDVMLLHGVTSSLAMWYNGIYPMLSESHRTTALDMRGHGLSTITPTGYSTADMSKDIVGLMDKLGIEKTILVGHSFGGACSMHTAMEHPDRIRGVMMLDTGLACLRYLRIIQEWDGWKKRPEEFQQRGLTIEQFLDLDSKQDVTEVIRHGLSMPRIGGFRKGQSAMTPRLEKLLNETKLGYEFRDVAGMTEEKLKSVTVPVIAMYGDNSPYKRMADHLHTLMPNCRQYVQPGAGHFAAVHRPELIMSVIKDFIADPLAVVKSQDVAH